MLSPGLGPLGGGPLAPIFFGVSIVSTILQALFGGIFGGSSTKALADAVTRLRTDFATAIDNVVRFAWKSVFALGTLLQLFHDVWISFFDKLWSYVKELGRLLKRLVDDVLPVVIKALRNARELLNTLYKRFIRPLMNYIQKVRKYLAILRALHVPFADKLDKVLARIEGKIIGPYLYVLRTLNGMGGWINVIVTAGGVIQRPLFIRTMYAFQADWVNMFWAGQTAGHVTPPAPSRVSQRIPPTNAQLLVEWDAYAQARSGTFADVIAQSFTYGDRANIGA